MSEERYTQFRRMFSLLELLRQFRFGCRDEFIVKELNERMGETYCLRTIQRDLQFLIEVGCVRAERYKQADGRRLPRYFACQHKLLEVSIPDKKIG